MSTPAIVAGNRGSGEIGLFVALPGIDALTAPQSQLTLGIATFIPQLMFLGVVAAGAHVVPLGLSRTPVVLLTSLQSMSGVIGYEGLTGPLRPSPWNGPASVNAAATINGNGASMTISSGAFSVRYEVYRKAIT